MASVGDKTAEGSVNVIFYFFYFRISAINVLKHNFSFFSISKFSLRTLYYPLDTFLELS